MSASETWPSYPEDEKPHFIEGNRDLMWLRPNRDVIGYTRNLWYALTIDGYSYMDQVWRVSEEDRDRKIMSFRNAKGKWEGRFEDLRACLFYYQRSIRWAEGSGRDKKGRREYDAIYEAVCDAWDKEYQSNIDQVRLAYRALGQRRQDSEG